MFYTQSNNEPGDELNDKETAIHRKNKGKERLKEHDVKQLMGVNRDRYKRIKGRVRRK